jgi:hypothetical protein
MAASEFHFKRGMVDIEFLVQEATDPVLQCIGFTHGHILLQVYMPLKMHLPVIQAPGMHMV